MDSNLPGRDVCKNLGQNRSASTSAGFSMCSGEERSFDIVFNATASHRPKHCDLAKFTRPRKLCSMLWDRLFSSTILLTSSSTFSCLPSLSRITSRSRSAACMSDATPNATKLVSCRIPARLSTPTAPALPRRLAQTPCLRVVPLTGRCPRTA